MVHSLPRPLHPLFIYPVHVTHNDARCLPSPFSHSQFASTYVVYRSSPTRLHTHESLLDGPYISPPHSPHHHLPLSSSLFFLFLNSFHALANLTTLPPPLFSSFNLPTSRFPLPVPPPFLGFHHHRACRYLFRCSLVFYFVCMPQLSISGPPCA
jgi:hypothetical protein